MAHTFQFAGSEHDVWLAPSAPGYCLHVDGKRIPVSQRPLVPDLFELDVGGKVEHVHVATHGDDVFVHLGGRTYHVRYTHSLERFANEQSDETLVSRAPMPGSVLSLLVAAGDSVSRGQTLLVIESMKMETSIDAAVDGIVKEVHVEPGQTFDRDALLVSLEANDGGGQQ